MCLNIWCDRNFRSMCRNKRGPKVHRLTDRSERVGEKSKGAYVLRSVYFEPVLVGGELCSLDGVYDGSWQEWPFLGLATIGSPHSLLCLATSTCCCHHNERHAQVQPTYGLTRSSICFFFAFCIWRRAASWWWTEVVFSSVHVSYAVRLL